MCVCEGERESVCVREGERESVCVCEGECVCAFLSICYDSVVISSIKRISASITSSVGGAVRLSAAVASLSLIMYLETRGQRSFHPCLIRRQDFAPVSTIFPDVNIRSTTGEFSGRKIRPGNIFFWYVQKTPCSSCRASRLILLFSGKRKLTLPTIFCMFDSISMKETPGVPIRSICNILWHAKTHSVKVFEPVSTSLPDVKSSTVQTGECRRSVIAANFCLS